MTNSRRNTKEILVGTVAIGGNNQISIQSMTNIPAREVEDNIKQICELQEAGCEIVRLAISSLDDIKNFAEIKKELRKKNINIPLVADTHFSPKIALDCLKIADKVRINAGNFSDKISSTLKFTDDEFLEGRKVLQDKLYSYFSSAKELNVPIRIGINHGSLAPRIVYKFGNTDIAMWESAKECLEAASLVGFEQIVLSFKASDTTKMISANRLAHAEMDARGWNFPIHLGVTESGDGDYARIKSAIGIGTLLSEGIGDTIRVSLTEDPIAEIGAAKNILQACGKRRYGIEIIACPSCGRTCYDIQSVIKNVKTAVKNLPQAKKLKIAVMGCAINGLGEAGDADFAIIGAPNGSLSIYKSKNCLLKNIPQKEICQKLLKIILSDAY